MTQQTFTGEDSVKDVLLNIIQPNDTDLYAKVAAATAGSGILISATDSTLGFLDSKLLAGPGVTLTKNNPSGDESFTILFSVVGDTTPQLGGDLDGDNKIASKITFKDTAEITQALGSIAVDTTIDVSAGNVVSFTLDADLTISFSNFSPTGTTSYIVLKMTNPGAYTTIWPAAVKWADDTEPSWTASGIDYALFMTDDAGTTIRGMRTGYYGGTA